MKSEQDIRIARDGLVNGARMFPTIEYAKEMVITSAILSWVLDEDNRFDATFQAIVEAAKVETN